MFILVTEPYCTTEYQSSLPHPPKIIIRLHGVVMYCILGAPKYWSDYKMYNCVIHNMPSSAREVLQNPEIAVLNVILFNSINPSMFLAPFGNVLTI